MSVGTIFNTARLLGDGSKKTRFAGSVFKRLREAAGVTDPVGAAIRFGPDVFFGALDGVMTPGDLSDKIIAGTTSTIGNTLGGVGLSAAFGTKAGSNMNYLTDIIGSTAGSFGSMPVSDAILRGKDKLTGGKGLSPYEKIGEDQRKQIEQAILAQYGIRPQNTNLLNATAYSPLMGL